MKPSRFEGWLQLELSDIAQEGDAWAMKDQPIGVYPNNISKRWYGMMLATIYVMEPDERRYEMFRPIKPRLEDVFEAEAPIFEDDKPKQRFKLKSKPLPLP